MKKILSLPFVLLLLAFMSSCDPGSSTTGDNSGNHVTDTAKVPGPGDNKAARPWAANKNFFDPNLLDVIPDPIDLYMLPFSYPFIRTQGIGSIELRTYSHADNEQLDEATVEKDLVLSQKRVFLFDNKGRTLDVRDEKFLGTTDPAVSFHAAWTYAPTGQIMSIVFEDAMGTKKQSHTTTCTYREDGRPIATEDTKWLSTYMAYDDSLNHTYLLRKFPNDPTFEVWVAGFEGAFPDEVCKEMQSEILAKQNKFIDYGKAGSKLQKVIFLETKGRQALREVHMGAKGVIDYVIVRKYNADENVTERNFRWGEEGAKLSALTTYRYSATGDLEEVLTQRKPFNGDLSNQIDRYTYGADGMLAKQTRQTRKNNDAQVMEWVTFVTVTKAVPTPAAKNDAQPGGTH